MDTTNEKYALRIWLVRMGMGGDEYKASRKILMERLSGHTAFRTPADAEKAKEKAQKSGMSCGQLKKPRDWRRRPRKTDLRQMLPRWIFS